MNDEALKTISKVLIGSLTAQALGLVYHEIALPPDQHHQPHIEHNTSTGAAVSTSLRVIVSASGSALDSSIAALLRRK